MNKYFEVICLEASKLEDYPVSKEIHDQHQKEVHKSLWKKQKKYPMDLHLHNSSLLFHSVDCLNDNDRNHLSDSDW